MRVITFNANGIRSAAKKGFYDWLATMNADFVCIQETKAHLVSLQNHALFFPEGYVCHYVDALKKGYSGVALYARQQPQKIIIQLGIASADTEGRYIQFDYPNMSIASIYFPSGTSGEERQAVKYQFLAEIEQHFKTLKTSGRELILCGDFNIAHRAIDLKNWRSNQKHTGFLPKERAWLDMLFDEMGFVDAFRVCNQKPEQYTWWSQRGRARENNVGWRIDYQVVTPPIAKCITAVAIASHPLFSDHAPLVIDYSGEWCA
ncbi:MAG: exodeoxyribonuclease III [Legionella sp. 21-45-4]|nr:MAG: exodeoxyribonuclease III [Legionella sp. 21-45-4]